MESEDSNFTISPNDVDHASFPLQSSYLPELSPLLIVDTSKLPQDGALGQDQIMSQQTPARFDFGSLPSNETMFTDAGTFDTLPSIETAPSSTSSGRSPSLVDLLLPGTDMHATPQEYIDFRAQYPESLYQPAGIMPDPMEEDEEVEEIIREPAGMNPDHEAWVMRLPSPTASSSSSSSSGSPTFGLLLEPQFALGGPEMMTMLFDRQTCGILSVKDGPNENPWRNLIWPMAKDSPALYHAIASMTCFHASRTQPQLRIKGIEHVRSSMSDLAAKMSTMRIDAAIATTLALGFSESWDSHIKSGIDHIKGARALVKQALMQQATSMTDYTRTEMNRLKFLCNTWIYMDVIARLTSVDDDTSTDFDFVSSAFLDTDGLDAQVDPLMGCAATLFPLIGRVANLVRRVRCTQSNSPAIISQAMELKSQLERWIPPPFFEDPEDPTSDSTHSLQTAEAYRWATLLYLHQAVPEIPSLSSAELAKKVMVFLATVPLHSRAVIVQIFPLTAAGCEARDPEDREWVRERWTWMARRMLIGVIDRSAEVTYEVWRRRDEWELQRAAEEDAQRRRNGGRKIEKLSSLKRAFTLDNDLPTPLTPLTPLTMGTSSGIEEDSFGWMNPFPSTTFDAPMGQSQKRRATSGAFDMPEPRPVSRRKSDRDVDSPGGMDREMTVRGRLHWLGVMKDWDWEGKLLSFSYEGN